MSESNESVRTNGKLAYSKRTKWWRFKSRDIYPLGCIRRSRSVYYKSAAVITTNAIKRGI